MIIAEQFTIAKIWKQPKCSSIDEWIKMWCMSTHTYTMEYYSAPQKNKILPFATMWMDPEGIMLSEISQNKTKTLFYHLYVNCEKINLYLKNRNRLTDVENKLVTTSVEG